MWGHFGGRARLWTCSIMYWLVIMQDVTVTASAYIKPCPWLQQELVGGKVVIRLHMANAHPILTRCFMSVKRWQGQHLHHNFCVLDGRSSCRPPSRPGRLPQQCPTMMQAKPCRAEPLVLCSYGCSQKQKATCWHLAPAFGEGFVSSTDGVPATCRSALASRCMHVLLKI